MFCSQCGAEVQETQRFCARCGAKIVQLPEEKVVEPKALAEPEVAAKPETAEPEVLAEPEVAAKPETAEPEALAEPEVAAKPETAEPEALTEPEKVTSEPVVEPTLQPLEGVVETKSTTEQSSTGASSDKLLVLQIFAGVCAVVCIGNFVSNAINGVKSVFNVLEAFEYYGLYGVVPLFSSVLQVVQGLLFLVGAIVLILFMARKDENETETLFVVLAESGVLALAVIIVRFFLAVISMLYYQVAYFPKEILGLLVLYVIVIGGVYGIMYLLGRQPLAGKMNWEAIKELAIQAPKDMIPIFKAFAEQMSDTAQNVSEKVASSQQPGNDLTVTNGNAYANYGRRRLRTDRSLIVLMLLSFITCGIYDLFFIHSLAKDVNTACEGDGEHTSGLLAFILLTFVTCGIYAYIWHYKLGNRLARNGMRYGAIITENGTTVLMWHIFGSFLCGIGPFIALNIIIKNTNVVCYGYNQANVTM